MLHECRATHVYGSFATQKTMLTLISKFDLRKCQFQVKLGQIWSDFKIQNSLTAACLCYPVSSQDSKNVIYFYVHQLEIPKKCISKSDITFTGFLPIAQPHIKILLRSLVCVLFVCSFTIYIRLFITPKFWIS